MYRHQSCDLYELSTGSTMVERTFRPYQTINHPLVVIAFTMFVLATVDIAHGVKDYFAESAFSENAMAVINRGNFQLEDSQDVYLFCPNVPQQWVMVCSASPPLS